MEREIVLLTTWNSIYVYIWNICIKIYEICVFNNMGNKLKETGSYTVIEKNTLDGLLGQTTGQLS